MRNLDYYIDVGYKWINSYFASKSLSHHGIKGQKWGVRRFQNKDGSLTEEGKKRYSKDKTNQSIDLQFFSEPLSIYDPESNKDYNLMDGTYIRDKQVFAGKGGQKPIKAMTKEELVNTYGGEPENWQHSKGNATLNYYNEARDAEVHWFEEENAGKFEYVVKKWLN